MKTTMRFLQPIVLATATVVSVLRADTVPGEIDLQKFFPGGGSTARVSVELNGAVLGFAKALAAREEPEAASLIAGLKLVRVNVFSLEADGERPAMAEKFSKLRQELETGGWQKVVSVKEKKDDVAIHLKMRGEIVEGLVVSVIDSDKEAVLVNLVGEIAPEQLGKLAGKLDIQGLEKAADVLKKKE
jgi:hypothetical protein